jgi:ethanolamine ammonia-lyase small subunit
MTSPPTSYITRDPWLDLARRTPARIALGRAGVSLPTDEVLRFALAHAQARDAVHAALDAGRMTAELERLGLPVVAVNSAAPDRAVYLRRPDLGRRLSPESRQAVAEAALVKACDLAIVVADGLSATAIHAQATALLRAFLPWVRRHGWRLGSVVLAHQARVALGDEVGALLGARAVAVLIGERPGLSAPDSLGIYLTYAPRPGRMDAERNCISNVRPDGLGYDLAAGKLAWLLDRAFTLRLTGVSLKDESDAALPTAHHDAITGDRVDRPARTDRA